MADLNEAVGDLGNMLYKVDINQMLLIKGGSDRFHSTIEDHEPLYEKGEVADITLSITRQSSIRDSVDALFRRILALEETTPASQADWIALTRRWQHSVETTLANGDTLMTLVRTRAEKLADSLASLETFSPEKTALHCGVGVIGPGYPDIATFKREASDADWREFIALLVSCARKPWVEGWYGFVQTLFRPGASMTDPFLGQITFFRLPEVASAATGWEAVDRWGRGEGVIDLQILPAGTDSLLPREEALAVLLPESGPSGSLIQTFFLDEPKPFVAVPSGTYRLLVFMSGAYPEGTAPFVVDGSEDTRLTLNYYPFNPQPCRLGGGRVDTWVLDPSDGAHLNIPCNCPCPTEVWEGETVFQSPFRIDSSSVEAGSLLRRKGTFHAVLSCTDRTFTGEGTGTFSIVDFGGDCSYRIDGPVDYTFQVSGERLSTTGMEIEFIFSGDSLFAARSCPGEGEVRVDLRDAANQGFTSILQPDTYGRAEVVFPAGSTEESIFHIRTTLKRIF